MVVHGAWLQREENWEDTELQRLSLGFRKQGARLGRAVTDYALISQIHAGSMASAMKPV